jgi:membrane-associated phospholipid phosphatase
LLGSYPVAYTIAVTSGLIVGLLLHRWLPLCALVAAVPTENFLQGHMTAFVHGTKPAQALAVGPPGGFFSGGSARTLIVCGLLAYFLGWLGLARRQRSLIWTLTALATLGEGYSRLYLGRHWAVDIVGGWVFGALVLASFVFAAEALRPSADPEPSAPAPKPAARHEA